MPLDCCVTTWDRNGDVEDDVAVYLGLSGLVNDALLDEVEIDEGADAEVVLRNTRAGGN